MTTVISTCVLEDTCVRGTSNIAILWITETDARNCNGIYIAIITYYVAMFSLPGEHVTPLPVKIQSTPVPLRPQLYWGESPNLL